MLDYTYIRQQLSLSPFLVVHERNDETMKRDVNGGRNSHNKQSTTTRRQLIATGLEEAFSCCNVRKLYLPVLLLPIKSNARKRIASGFFLTYIPRARHGRTFSRAALPDALVMMQKKSSSLPPDLCWGQGVSIVMLLLSLRAPRDSRGFLLYVHENTDVFLV